MIGDEDDSSRPVTPEAFEYLERQLAESQPELVCGLHCGMVEGFVTELGGQRVTDFHPLADQTPCRVELVST